MRYCRREEVIVMHSQTNEKKTKEKTFTKISKFLHNILKATKVIYEICRVLRSIMDLFH